MPITAYGPSGAVTRRKRINWPGTFPKKKLTLLLKVVTMFKMEEKRSLTMASNKIILACSECGSRNYTIKSNNTARTERLEVKKYCRFCNKHTLHKETK